MAEEAGLWDDSAIVNAFNHAVTKYKVKEMNKQKQKKNSISGETPTDINHEKLPSSINEEQEVIRSMKVEDDNTVVLSTVKDAAEATDLPSFQENNQTDSSATDPLVHASSSHNPEGIEGYKNTQREMEYNQLLSHYYELQEQMQKVVQQLYQVGNEPSQITSGSGSQWGTCGSTQDHQDPNAASHPVAVSSCCPYACYCLGDSYPSLPACSLCGACVGNMNAYSAATATACTGGPGKLSSLNDDPAAKTAMKAAERAIASVKEKTSGTTNVHEGDEHSDSSKGKMAQNISSGTDLDVVLSAWYTAGFHTGRYLMEQSNTKKGQHG